MTTPRDPAPTAVVSEFYQNRLEPDTIGSLASAQVAFKPYVDYLTKTAEQCGRLGVLVDVGCGRGWSSFLIAGADVARMVVGVDVLRNFVTQRPRNVLLLRGDGLRLPLADGSVDAASCYQYLEHVPQPDVALREMMRIVKPGGLIIVAGPNLLSPLVCLQGLTRCWRRPSFRAWFRRGEEELRSPFGNAPWEVVWIFIRNVMLLTKKAWSSSPTFRFREPDLREPAHADTDACYLLNPLDVRKYFAASGFEIVKYQDGGTLRLRGFGSLKGGTWLVCRKPRS